MTRIYMHNNKKKTKIKTNRHVPIKPFHVSLKQATLAASRQSNTPSNSISQVPTTVSFCRLLFNYILQIIRKIWIFFQLHPLGVATTDHLCSSQFIPCFLFCNTNNLHVLLHYIHEPSLWFSSIRLTYQLYIQYSLSNMSTINPLYMFKTPQPWLS